MEDQYHTLLPRLRDPCERSEGRSEGLGRSDTYGGGMLSRQDGAGSHVNSQDRTHQIKQKPQRGSEGAA